MNRLELMKGVLSLSNWSQSKGRSLAHKKDGNGRIFYFSILF
uniref:Uncharacterized protein n=1 Tax=Lepeophtheirus salmonis TaxID=72036 RepID=A0A0K2TY09_LEPSM